MRHLYDFLTESLLFRRLNDDGTWSGVDEKEVLAELGRYREHVERVAEPMQKAASERTSGLSVVFDSTTNGVALDTLRQVALFHDFAIIDDPLFRLSAPRTLLADGFEQTLGYGDSRATADEVAEACLLMREATPMVAGNFLQILPFSREREVPVQTPIYASDTGFADALPAPLMRWMTERARVLPYVQLPDGGGWEPRSDLPLEPRRSIWVEFDGHPPAHFYHLLEHEVVIVDEATRYVGGFMRLPDAPPTEDAFRAWVTESVHRAAFAVVDEARMDIANADRAGGILMTRSRLFSELRREARRREPGAGNAELNDQVAELAFQLELPLITEASVEDIMRVRANDSGAFMRYRSAVERSLREIRLIEDEAKRNNALTNLAHELSTIQVREVEMGLESIKPHIAFDVVAAAVSLGVQLANPTAGLIGLAITAAKVAHDAVKEVQRRQELPGTFLWKVKHRKS